MTEWAKRYDCCRYCNTSEKAHKSRGLCGPCYYFMIEYVTGPKQDDQMADFFGSIFHEHLVGWSCVK